MFQFPVAILSVTTAASLAVHRFGLLKNLSAGVPA
jgi:hypothetical protein